MTKETTMPDPLERIATALERIASALEQQTPPSWIMKVDPPDAEATDAEMRQIGDKLREQWRKEGRL